MQFFSNTTLENEECRTKMGMNLNAFGMIMPGRSINDTTYRFGFNGQEKDDEITGVSGANTTAMFWEYDSRLGRRWNLDPITKPWQSDYSCFSDNPISAVDPLGADDYHIYQKGRRNDKIKVTRNENPTNTYYYINKRGISTNLGTYDKITKNVNGTNVDIVNFAQDNNFLLRRSGISADEFYMNEDAFAGLLGAAFSFYQKTDRQTTLHGIMYSNGLHSTGRFIGSYDAADIRYQRTDASGTRVTTDDPQFDKAINQQFVNLLVDYGFTTLYTLDRSNGSNPALANTNAAANHHHHLHIEGFNATIGTYNPASLTNQATAKFWGKLYLKQKELKEFQKAQICIDRAYQYWFGMPRDW